MRRVRDICCIDARRAAVESAPVFRLILLLTKGIIRDPHARRKLMFWVMMTAMLMLFFGSVLLSDRWAREHHWIYLFYWLACAWLTLAGMLLALLDVLIIRAKHRITRRKIEQEILKKGTSDDSHKG